MSKTCVCGHHAQAHLGETGLCGAPSGCDCNRFEPSKPVSSPKRYAEMTGAELVTDRLSRVSASVSLEQVSVQQRDAILAERASEVIGMRDTIDALRTRAERAEQLVREIEVDAQEVRMALRTAEQERDALKDEVAGFEAMWEAREKAHDAALGEAFVEGAEWIHGRGESPMIRAEAARRYPATPSGEGVTCKSCRGTGTTLERHGPGLTEELSCVDCQGTGKPATPQPEPDGEIRLDVYDDDGYVRYEHIRITAPLARRLLALAQTGEK
jgi:hypothetical protein